MKTYFHITGRFLWKPHTLNPPKSIQSNPQPPNTSQNHPQPPKITQNHQQLPKTTHNQMVWSFHTRGRKIFSSFYLILQLLENNLCNWLRYFWEVFLRYNNTQNRSFTDGLQNRCSENYCKFHWKATVLESLLNKVVALNECSFIKKRLQLRCFPVKLTNILRTPFLHNTTGGCF